jgi:hypothetical protein
MAAIERQGMSGRLTLVLRDEQGREVDRRVVDNLITDEGRNMVARFFTGILQAAPRLFIAVGRGRKGPGGQTAPPAPMDKALEDLADRAQATVAVTGTVATVTATLRATGGGEAQALEEAGIQIEVSGREPVLYNRVVFPVVNKSANMEMTLSWEVSF